MNEIVLASTDQGVLTMTPTIPCVRTEKEADALRHALLAAIDEAGARQVVIDLRHVKYLGSTGFRPLLGVFRHLQAQGGRLVLCGLSAEVAHTFSVTRLVGMSRSPFDIEPDPGAAVARLNRDGTPRMAASRAAEPRQRTASSWSGVGRAWPSA